jgi:hypothetical protein
MEKQRLPRRVPPFFSTDRGPAPPRSAFFGCLFLPKKVRIAAKKGLIKEKNGQIVAGKNITNSRTGQHNKTIPVDRDKPVW